MKLSLLSLLAVASLSAQAGNVLVANKGYDVTVDESGVETRTESRGSEVTYTYNADGQRYLKFRNGYTEYRYDEAGRVSIEIAYTNYGSQLNYMERNAYDAEGNLVTKTRTSGSGDVTTTTYSDFENGQYKHVEVLYSYSDKPQAMDVVVAFDDQNRLIRRFGASANMLEVMTYNEAGQLSAVEQDYFNDGYSADLSLDPTSPSYSKKVYTYGEDGQVTCIRTIRSSSISDEDYIYADVDFSKAPKNLKAVAGANNTIELTWDAVEGAEAYNVIRNKDYGNDTIKVVTNSYVVPTLMDGTYYLQVSPIIGGKLLAVSSTRVPCKVKDTSKVPATDFQFLSAVHELIVHNESWGDWSEETYTVTVSWKEPAEGVQGRKLSYGPSEWDRVDITDVTTTDGVSTGKAILQSYACVDTNWDTNETTPKNLSLSCILVFATGNADPSNVVTVKVAEVATEKEEDTPTAVDAAVSAVVVGRQAYTVNGQRAAGFQSGISIVKETLSDGSVRVSKVIR